MVQVPALDRLVSEQVLDDFDHKYMNVDVGEFQALVPTSENIIRVIEERLEAHWQETFPGEWPRLETIRLARNQTQSVSELTTMKTEASLSEGDARRRRTKSPSRS